MKNFYRFLQDKGKQIRKEGKHEFINKSIQDIQKRIFQYMQLDQLSINQIEIQKDEKIKTTFIKSKTNNQRVFYLGHGFGGTSLMYFPIINQLLTKGDVVLWQIRGMGLMSKNDYPVLNEEQVQNFYYQGIKRIVQFYQHDNIIFISHSFGAYITMRFAIRYSRNFKILKCLLLSPIGITPIQKDYKNNLNTYADFFHYIYSWVGWKFNVTYKSVLKSLGKYLKLKLIRNSLSKFDLKERQLQLMIDLFDVLTDIPGGSQKHFYKLILPRVIPNYNQSIQELIQNNQIPFEIKFLYGGHRDWVDKQGSLYLSEKFQNCSLQLMNNCTHMIPLHVQQLKSVIKKQLATP